MDIWSSVAFASGGPNVGLQARIHNDDGTDSSLGVSNTTHPGDYSMKSSATGGAPKNGFVTNLTVQIGGSGVARGRVWARAYVVDSGGARRGTLAEGYIEDGRDLSRGTFDTSGEGRGWYRKFFFPNNSFVSLKNIGNVPSNAVWRLRLARVQLYAGGPTGASRYPLVEQAINDPNNSTEQGVVYTKVSTASVPGGGSAFGGTWHGRSTWSSGSPTEYSTAVEDALTVGPYPQAVGQSAIQSAFWECINFQSGDNWNPALVLFEEWIVPGGSY